MTLTSLETTFLSVVIAFIAVVNILVLLISINTLEHIKELKSYFSSEEEIQTPVDSQSSSELQQKQ